MKSGKQNPQKIIEKSKSKSNSKNKTLQKLYKSPVKIQIDLKPYHKKCVDRFKSKADQSSGEHKQQYSASKSKSKSKNKTLKGFQSKKKIASPYLQTNQNTKKILNKAVTKDKEKQDIKLCVNKIKNRKYEQAVKILSKMLNNNVKNFDAAYYLGLIAQEKQIYEDAKKYYNYCIKIEQNENQRKRKNQNQQNVDKLEKLANCHFYLKHHQIVIDLCNKILNKKRQSQIYQLKGKSLIERKKFGPAIDSFTNAIQLNKNNFKLYQYQGDCYKGIQAYELALNCYSKSAQNLVVESLNLLQKKLECFRLLGNIKKQQQIQQKIINLKKQYNNQNLVVVKAPLIKRKTQQPSQQMKIDQPRLPKRINLGLFPQFRPNSPNLESVSYLYENGNMDESLKMINKIIQNQGQNIKNLQIRALVNFQLQNHQNCENDIKDAINLLQNPNSPFTNLLLANSQQISLLNGLKIVTNRLKQLNAYSLTEQQDKYIAERRKKCLQQALNVFKNHQKPQSRQQNGSLLSSKLTMILQQSSIRSSRVYDNQQNSIFLLRNIRKVLKNWCNNNFSLQSLETTTDLAYNLVKIRYKQFSILPMHIIYYTIKQQNCQKTFAQINDQINSVLNKMCKKYPPSQIDISKSSQNLFNVKWQNKPKINEFQCIGKLQFHSFKELNKAIQMLADKAQQEYYKMSYLCQDICVEKNGGHGFKIGLKLNKMATQEVQQRVLSRVVQKILSKDIKQKVAKFFNDILVKPNKKLSQYFNDVQKQWQETIDQIIKQKNEKKQQIKCHAYDFLRAKCKFSSVKNIKQVAEQFIQLNQKGQIQLLQIDDRLAYKTKDVVLKFKIRDIVGELQLAMQFQSLQNQFNHGLYQLFRSPFGAFFASVMWFSGFALKKNQIFFKQKIKWGLKGLQHLQKFIYEQQLYIQLINEQQLTSNKFIITDFDINTDTLYAHICTLQHLFLSFNQQKLQLQQKIQKPKMKFIIKAIKDNFIINQTDQYIIQLRVQGTNIFFKLNKQNKKLMPIQMQSSLQADSMKMRIIKNISYKQSAQNKQLLIESKSQEENKQDKTKNYSIYKKQIEQCKQLQKKLMEIIKNK